MLPVTPLPPPTPSSPFRSSPSSLALWQTCSRKFYYRYCYGIEGKVPPDDEVRFGNSFHKAVELNANKRVADWSVREATAGLEPDLGGLVAGTVAAYATYWAQSLRYRHVELKLETELRNPRLTLVTILDGLAETAVGDLVVVDHKTTKSDIRPGSWFWEKLQLDRQVSTYIWAARVNGHDVARAEWDAIKKPKIDRRTEEVPPEYYARSGKWGEAGSLKPGTGVPAETVGEYAKRVRDELLADPTTYFQRGPVHRLDDELEAAIGEVEDLGTQILNAWDTDSWPRNPSNCFSYGRKCEYWDVCTGSAQPTDTTLYQIRRRRES